MAATQSEAVAIGQQGKSVTAVADATSVFTNDAPHVVLAAFFVGADLIPPRNDGLLAPLGNLVVPSTTAVPEPPEWRKSRAEVLKSPGITEVSISSRRLLASSVDRVLDTTAIMRGPHFRWNSLATTDDGEDSEPIYYILLDNVMQIAKEMAGGGGRKLTARGMKSCRFVASDTKGGMLHP